MADSQKIQNIVDRFFGLKTENTVEKTASVVDSNELCKKANDISYKLQGIISSAMVGVKIATGLSEEETSILNVLRAS